MKYISDGFEHHRVVVVLVEGCGVLTVAGVKAVRMMMLFRCKNKVIEVVQKASRREQHKSL